jgi:hypothetical protein
MVEQSFNGVGVAVGCICAVVRLVAVGLMLVGKSPGGWLSDVFIRHSTLSLRCPEGRLSDVFIRNASRGFLGISRKYAEMYDGVQGSRGLSVCGVGRTAAR